MGWATGMGFPVAAGLYEVGVEGYRARHLKKALFPLSHWGWSREELGSQRD